MIDIAELVQIVARQDGAPTPTPPGQTPPNRFPQIWGFMSTFLPLATIAVTLRFYSRYKYTHIGVDDIAILISYILYIGLIIATVFATKYGLGIHIWDVDYPKTGISMQQCGFSSQVLYPAAQGFAKLSILLFLSRVVPVGSPWKKRIAAFATFVVCQELAFTITLFLQCRPTSFYWNKNIKGGTCINQPAFYYVDAAVNITTDLSILSLPWFIFSSLQVPRRKKYALLGICSVGCFTLITSIIRLPFLHHLNQSDDPTWGVVDIATWSIAELGSAITTASIPTLRPLLTSLFPKIKFSSAGPSDPSSYNPDAKSGSYAYGGSRRPSNAYALSSIGGGKLSGLGKGGAGGGLAEIKGGRADNESEEYILSDGGKTIRQTVELSFSSSQRSGSFSYQGKADGVV